MISVKCEVDLRNNSKNYGHKERGKKTSVLINKMI